MKTAISQELSHLRNFGFKVYNFNNKKSISPGIKNFCDYLIISESHLIFVEVKIGKDVLNDEQKKLQSLICYLSRNNKSIYYFLLTNLEETKNFCDLLLSNNLVKYFSNKELN